MTDPIQVLREWVTVTERAYGRVRLTQTVTAEQAGAALQQVEALVQAARELVEDYEESDPFPTSDGHPLYGARAALAPFKENP